MEVIRLLITTSITQCSYQQFICSYTLEDCEVQEQSRRCIQNCESVWFKLLNVTNPAAKTYIEHCDPIYQEKYANVMYVIVSFYSILLYYIIQLYNSFNIYILIGINE